MHSNYSCGWYESDLYCLYPIPVVSMETRIHTSSTTSLLSVCVMIRFFFVVCTKIHSWLYYVFVVSHASTTCLRLGFCCQSQPITSIKPPTFLVLLFLPNPISFCFGLFLSDPQSVMLRHNPAECTPFVELLPY